MLDACGWPGMQFVRILNITWNIAFVDSGATFDISINETEKDQEHKVVIKSDGTWDIIIIVDLKVYRFQSKYILSPQWLSTPATI